MKSSIFNRTYCIIDCDQNNKIIRSEVNVDGEELLIMRESDILATL